MRRVTTVGRSVRATLTDENNCDEDFVLMTIIFKGKRPRAQKLRNSALKIYYKYKTERFYDYKQTIKKPICRLLYLVGASGECR